MMLGKGYFLGGIDLGSSNGSRDMSIDSNGNITFAPIDPIHIDENGLVHFSETDKNAYMYTVNNEIYVEKVI